MEMKKEKTKDKISRVFLLFLRQIDANDLQMKNPIRITNRRSFYFTRRTLRHQCKIVLLVCKTNNVTSRTTRTMMLLLLLLLFLLLIFEQFIFDET